MARTNTDQLWWQAPKHKGHENIFDAIAFYDTHQSHISDANLRHQKFYENKDIVGLGTGDYYKVHDSNQETKVTLNVIKSMVDTVGSKVTKAKPKPTFLTQNGSFSLQKKGKKLGKFIEGVFMEANVYRTMTKAFWDAVIFGTGLVHVFEEESRICIERVYPDEIVVDTEETLHAEPQQMFRRKPVSRQRLMAMFPGKKNEILNAARHAPRTSRNAHQVHQRADLIECIEAWHLPSGKKMKDGRHTIVIHNCTLLDEKWEHAYFPIVKMTWKDRPLGWWGFGLAEELVPIQQEINKLAQRIQQAMHRISVPRIFVEKGSKVVKSHLNNMNAAIVEYVGTPPHIDASASVHPEVFSHLDRLYQRAFEIAGISQLSAQSKKPSGLDSGVAIREFSDIESERFADVHISYENFMLDIARVVIDMSRAISAREGGFSADWAGRDFIESIKWDEVDLEEDQFVLKTFPTNFLPRTPSGQLATVTNMMEIGMLDREQAMGLLQYPDLESVTSLENADSEDIKAAIEEMEDGEYNPPESFQNLELGIKMISLAMLRAKRQGAKDDILELFRLWIEDATSMIEEAQAEAQAQQQQAQMQAAQLQAAAQAPPQGAGPDIPSQAGPLAEAGISQLT